MNLTGQGEVGRCENIAGSLVRLATCHGRRRMTEAFGFKMRMVVNNRYIQHKVKVIGLFTYAHV